MRTFVAVLVGLLAFASTAEAKQFVVRLKPHTTAMFRSQVLPRETGLDVTARAFGQPLRQGLTDGALTFALRGHGVTVLLQAKARRARARIEIANFRKHSVRVLVRVRTTPLPVAPVEPVEPDPLERVCESEEDTDCIDPADELEP